jgi:DNA-directed RNA polymerase specialized sigma24 family protein
MSANDSLMGGEANQFHTTRWTLVLASAHDQSQAGQAAFAALCRTYWYPLYAFARRRGHSPADAQDLTQGFFLHVLENRALGQVDQLKGKFRSFLLACFQNYLSVEVQRANRLKRGGQCEFVLEDAMAALRRVYVARGKESVFNVLKVFIGIAESTPGPSYEEAAKALDIGVGTVKTLIHRLRRDYLDLVREEVARTVSDPSEIEGEIHALCDALIAVEGRLKP